MNHKGVPCAWLKIAGKKIWHSYLALRSFGTAKTRDLLHRYIIFKSQRLVSFKTQDYTNQRIESSGVVYKKVQYEIAFAKFHDGEPNLIDLFYRHIISFLCGQCLTSKFGFSVCTCVSSLEKSSALWILVDSVLAESDTVPTNFGVLGFF